MNYDPLFVLFIFQARVSRIGKEGLSYVANASLVSSSHLAYSVAFSMLNCLGFELIYENPLRKFQGSIYFFLS